MSSPLEYAASYAAAGLWTHPLKRGTKKPATDNGFKDASTDGEVLAQWFQGGANIGIACTPETGKLLIDVDQKHGGLETFAQLEAELGPFPLTPRVETPGGGFHLYVVHPQDDRGNQAASGSGIDLRGSGYGVAPPSVLPDGGVYRWSPGRSLHDVGFAELPSNWLARLRGQPGRTRARSSSVGKVSQPGSIPEGQRNTALFKEACRLRSLGLHEREILNLVLVKNQIEAAPPLDDAEVGAVVTSAMKYDPRENEDVSDVANARRLRSAMAGDFRYSAGDWWQYRNGCWRAGARPSLVQIAIAVGDTILADRRLMS